jgi:hypothetical protein
MTAGKGQQEFTQPTKTENVSQTEKYGHGPTGPGTKNDCASEGQQQFTQN